VSDNAMLRDYWKPYDMKRINTLASITENVTDMSKKIELNYVEFGGVN
jgi:hypothetical protein